MTLDPFHLTADQLRHLLSAQVAALSEIAALHRSPYTQVALDYTEHLVHDLDAIPRTTYTRYRRFAQTGDRDAYEMPYTRKRQKLSAAVLRVLLGENGKIDAVHDYLWAICDEHDWVVPAHAGRSIDLYAADTGLVLAETLTYLGDRLDGDVRHRVRQTIEQRIFDRYFRFAFDHRWYQSHDNWNAVCNSAVGATFLLLEPEPQRMAAAVMRALAGLRVYLDDAFAADGSTSEGVAYWHYGMSGFVTFAEMLRARSGGAIDLLGTDRVRQIAAYPAKLQLPGGLFASFSDSPERVVFNPGILTRFAERAGEPSLLALLAPPLELESDGLPSLLRFILWRTDVPAVAPEIADATLPDAGFVRLVTATADSLPVAVVIKAGNNGERHNHNDVGSFILSVGGENLLTDPGPGQYDRDYFNGRRYESVFANSYGHGVPRIGGQLQGVGAEFAGRLVAVETQGETKRAVVEFARAYPLPALGSATRQVTLAAEGTAAGTVWLQDNFQFAGQPGAIEEAFVTWAAVDIDGNEAVVRGQTQCVRLVIETPTDAAFTVEQLADRRPQHGEAGEAAVLTRLSFALPTGETRARIRMAII